jgi:hypothetical protein
MMTAITRVFFRGSAPSRGSTRTTFHTFFGTVTLSRPSPISSL